MAANVARYPLGSPQEHYPMCEQHTSPIDMVCEDCEEFICSNCAKTQHKEHNWSTINTAAVNRRRELRSYLQKVREDELQKIDSEIQSMASLTESNKSHCDSQLRRIQIHCDKILAWVTETKTHLQQTLKTKLNEKNKEVKEVKSRLEERRALILDLVGSLENCTSMSDRWVIDSYRQLTQTLSCQDHDLGACKLTTEYREGGIQEEVLRGMVGLTFDPNDLTLSEKESFKHSEGILTLKASSEEECYLQGNKTETINLVNSKGEEKQKLTSKPFHFCMAENRDIYITDNNEKSINCLSSSGDVQRRVVSTNPLVPVGICQTKDSRGLLITLKDDQSEPFALTPQSRCLVRQISWTGDLVQEYEYQADGKTRLFVGPLTVAQNDNLDICVVNITSDSSSELVILSSSGLLKSVYQGQGLDEDFVAQDVICDPAHNILVSDHYNHSIHLLGPDGGFLRFLLTYKDMREPSTLSLYNSTLWVGSNTGAVKVYHYNCPSL